MPFITRLFGVVPSASAIVSSIDSNSEGIQRVWPLAAFGLEGEDRPELVVAEEEDSLGTEGESSRRLRGDLGDCVHSGLIAALAAVGVSEMR